MKIKIIKPSKEIFEIVESYKSLIKKALPKSKITLIGSFAIPMCGKEEFDLLVEVDNVEKAQQSLQEKYPERFGIGPIMDGEGFCRSKKRFGIICELHIVSRNHKKIKQYLGLINKLKSNPEIVKEYSKLKWSLDGSSEKRYKEEKSKFLRKLE
jgi:GrpB-like predicted nucleotidyltransferase (UPF0157 family)